MYCPAMVCDEETLGRIWCVDRVSAEFYVGSLSENFPVRVVTIEVASSLHTCICLTVGLTLRIRGLLAGNISSEMCSDMRRCGDGEAL